MLDLLRRDRQNRKDLNHDLSDYVHHFRCRRHLSIVFKASEKILYVFEDVDESVLACSNILDCLRILSVNFARAKVLRRIALKGGHRLQQRSLSLVRIPIKS